MNRFTVWITACFAIFAALLLLAVALTEAARADRLKISTRQDSATVFAVTVTLRDVTADYRWLSVYLCSADVSEHGTYCNGFWDGRSGRSVRTDRSQQEPIPFRHVPRGSLLVIAAAFDAEHKALAKNQATVLRGF